MGIQETYLIRLAPVSKVLSDAYKTALLGLVSFKTVEKGPENPVGAIRWEAHSELLIS